MRIEAERSEEHILRLTIDQYRILDALNRKRRVAIGGCAGSGKTYLAVEKARRLVSQGYRVLLTCFNRSLAEHLSSLAPKDANLTVANWHSLCRQIAAVANVALPPFDRSVSNEGLDEAYVDALCDAFAFRPELRYDAVLVDEGQDFDYQWWLGLEACLRTDGFLYVFYDDNQTLYKGRGNLPAGMTEILLQENIRNAKPIFEIVSRFYRNDDGAEMVGKGPAGRSVEKVCYANESELQRLIGKALSRLIVNEQIPSCDVVVLTPKRLDRSCLMQGRLPGPIQLVPNTVPHRNNEVTCSTIHSFKGLERKVVLVAELDEDFLRCRKEDLATRCYVGFSRASTHLELFGTSRALDAIVD
jgi:superfamily I DNA/RNA helicase